MDKEKLVEKIDESGISRKKIAEVLGITPQGLNRKIKGETEFKVSEAKLLGQILKMSDREIIRIFLPGC